MLKAKGTQFSPLSVVFSHTPFNELQKLNELDELNKPSNSETLCALLAL